MFLFIFVLFARPFKTFSQPRNTQVCANESYQQTNSDEKVDDLAIYATFRLFAVVYVQERGEKPRLTQFYCTSKTPAFFTKVVETNQNKGF